VPGTRAEALLAGALIAAAPLAAQDTAPPPSRTEASQVGEIGAAPARTAPKAYLDPAPAAAPAASPAETDSAQIGQRESLAPARQIAPRAPADAAVAQLSAADLDATLAQLTPGERRVLLQAIEGSDICNNPPQVAAIVALCQSRIETRAQEFATARAERTGSAEDRLLRGDSDNQNLPSLSQVIERLARGTAASDDFNNQAIASIALATPDPAAGTAEKKAEDATGLSEATQGLVNAIINQLGGRAP
jgi:hypothetical protein